MIYTRDQANLKLAPNFTAGEFFCKCGKCINQPISSELVAKLQLLRNQMGRPIIFTSAYRCPAYNAKIGGARNSRHLIGDAVDIAIAGMDWRLLVREAKAVGFRGIGYGQHRGFIHVDLGAVREWDY